MTSTEPEAATEFVNLGPEPAYFNCSYMAPMLRSTSEAGARALMDGPATRPWTFRFPASFNEPVDEVRALVAELVHAEDPGSVAVVPSVAYAVATAVQQVRADFEAAAPGECGVLVMDDQFVSNYLAWNRLCKDTDADFVVARAAPDEEDPTEALLRAMRERVAAKGRPFTVVALAPVHWSDGRMVDLARVSALCHEQGSRLFLDATQSLGVLPLDVSALDPDWVAAAGYKWLMVPCGTAFFYMAPRLFSVGRPIEEHNFQFKVGGMMPDGAYDPSALARGETVHTTARRFDVGERSNFAQLAMAKASLSTVLAWGREDKVAKHTKTITDEICRRATSELGMRVVDERFRAPHLTGLRFAPEHGATAERLAKLLATLKAEDVHVSVRGDAIRVSPHLWSTLEHVDRLVKGIRRVMEQDWGIQLACA